MIIKDNNLLALAQKMHSMCKDFAIGKIKVHLGNETFLKVGLNVEILRNLLVDVIFEHSNKKDK